MTNPLHYTCPSTDLARAMDEMADWLGQQLVVLGNTGSIQIKVCCSKQHMNVRGYQLCVPQFKQRLAAMKLTQLVFEPVEQGPHYIEMEVTKMSGSWFNRALGGLKDMFSEQENSPERSNTQPQAAATAQVNIQTEASRYDPIRYGMEQACRQLMQTVRAHVAIAPEDVLVLRQVRVRGLDEDSKALLADFEREFGTLQRSRYLQKLLQDQKSSANVVLQDLLVEIICEPTEAAQDAFACVTQALNRNEAVSGVDVQLFGEWEVRELTAPVAPAAPVMEANPVATPVVMPSVAPAVIIKLKIFDAQTPMGREVELSAFPCSVGKAPQQQLVVAGQFVSSAHAVLDWSAATGLVYTDGSTNGSWSQQGRLEKNTPHKLQIGDQLRLAASCTDSKDVSLAPRLEVLDMVLPSDNLGATPVIMPSNLATPVVTALPVFLARLAIEDANGKHELPISACPFCIGRAQDQDYVVPQANLNVSGNHLLIREISERGAHVEHLAYQKNGSAKTDNSQQKLPAEFAWRFDEQLILAPRDSERAVRLTLLRP